MDLTLSRLARPRKEENALSRYNFGHTRKTWGREGKGRETEWFRARGSSLGKETIESLSFFSRLSLFFPFLSPREIYIRDVRGFDKLRDCRRRFKDIRAKVFTSFSAGFQILFFLPRILIPCIVRVGLRILKKKMRGISREENFTSEKYNSVYTSCIDDRVYTRSLWSKSWRIDSIRLLCRTIAHFHARKSYCASAFTSPCPLFVKMITQKVVLTVQRLRRTFYLAS